MTSNTCPNCGRTFRKHGNGLAFHLTWCKPAEPTIGDTASRRDEDGAPDTHGPALAHDFGDPCACSDCAGSDPLPELPSRDDMHPVVAHLLRGTPLPDDYRIILPNAHCDDCARAALGIPKDPEPEPPVSAHAPKARKVAEHKAPKLPATGTGKHSRCVAHVSVNRPEGITYAGIGGPKAPVSFACFDVAPSTEQIAERVAFIAEVDASWSAHHAAELARPTPDGLVSHRYALTADDARADRWIDERVPGWRAGFNAAGTIRKGQKASRVFIPNRGGYGSSEPRELIAA